MTASDVDPAAEDSAVTTGQRLDRALTDYLAGLEEADLSGLTIEAVAQIAGVSRATAYRHFKNRDTLLFEAAVILARRHLDRCTVILEAVPGLVGKLEEVFAYIAREIRHDRMLRLLLSTPRAAATDAAIRSMGSAVLGPAVRAGQHSGEVRDDVSCDELLDWLTEQIYVALRLELDERQVRLWVRRFIVPVLPPPDGDRSGRPHLLAALGDVESQAAALVESIRHVRSSLG